MVIFDLDDTIYKEMEFVDSACRAVADAVGSSGLLSAVEALRIINESPDTGKGFDNLSAVLWELDPTNGLSAERMVEIYRTHIPDITLTASVRRTLDTLKDRDVRMGIITDGRSHTQWAKIRALGLEKYVDADNIIVSGDTGYDKTSRVPFDMMAERSPGERQFVYFGDNPAKDFRWPNRMGWVTVQLDDSKGNNIHSQQIDVTDDYQAAHHVASFADILAFAM